jgi:hypothetical protein
MALTRALESCLSTLSPVACDKATAQGLPDSGVGVTHSHHLQATFSRHVKW